MALQKIMLEFNRSDYTILIANDDTYTAGSADNPYRYDREYLLGDAGYYPSSRHSVRVKAGESMVSSCILIASGGSTGIHEHSALIHEDSCLIAVGPYMCSLHIPSLVLQWKVEADDATCFGVYNSAKHRCLISHGELEIARVSYEGNVVWKSGGKDIFTNGFAVLEDYVEAVDSNDERYRFGITTGKEI